MPTGGAITLNRKNSQVFDSLLRSDRWCGISNRRGSKYDVTSLGWNYYMNEFSATIGIEQLKKLDRMNSKRKKIAKRYSKELQVDSKMPFNKDCAYHLFWIQISNRDKFRKMMDESGIETGIHYLPIHQMKYYKRKSKLAITEKAGKNIVSLPIHPNLNELDVDKIINLTNKFTS